MHEFELNIYGLSMIASRYFIYKIVSNDNWKNFQKKTTTFHLVSIIKFGINSTVFKMHSIKMQFEEIL